MGVEKRAYLPVMFNDTDIAAMQRIRRAMDPQELANAGKMFPVDDSTAGPVLDPALAAITHQERALVRPETVAEVQEAVLTYRQLLPRGGGSKPGMSAAMDEHITVLDVKGLSGVLEYEPAEYTFTALAGTPVAEVEALLAEHGQYLPFDPPLGASGATLGGTLAAGLSGPGRYRYGGVRDFILNVRLVDGLGQLVRGGGKVVKNAAGFDLPKLLVGSAGRLGVVVVLTFKVFPCPPAYATLRRDYGDFSQALEAMAKLGTVSLDIEAIDLEPAQRSSRLSVRLAGLADLLAARLDRLRSLMGDGEALQGPAEATYWEESRQFQWVPADWSLVKVPITPSLVPALDGTLSTSDLKRRYSVGGNVAWIAQPGRLAGLDNTLIELGLDGVAVLGPARVRVPFLGARRGTAFAARVKQALDPLERFPEL